MNEKKKYAAFTACSDPLDERAMDLVKTLKTVLEEMGIPVLISPLLFEGGSKAGGREKARILEAFYQEERVEAIFDVSGGNLANELLPWLDFEKIKTHPKPFFGYSDLTVLLNAIYQKTGQKTVLYQVKNLVLGHWKEQREAFAASILGKERKLFQFPTEFWRGNGMEGTLVGGNVRCLLKLAGTEYFPDLSGKILFLESLGGGEHLIRSYLAQLSSMGAFEKIEGLLLGTFTELEKQKGSMAMKELLFHCLLPENLPVAKTWAIGHGADSKALLIGGTVRLK